MDEIRFCRAGDRAVLMVFGNEIREEINSRVQETACRIREAAPEEIVETVPAFSSLLVHYRPEETDYDNLCRKLSAFAAPEEKGRKKEKRILKVPVCYGGRFGKDWVSLEQMLGMDREEIIRIHSGRDYKIYMMGFLPGFVYLGGLDERIACPRLSSPRVKIEPGSVGIGGSQTGIYPMASPGGWRLIGQTPIDMYDSRRTPPVWVRAGDFIRFVPISLEEWYEIRRKASFGTYQPEILLQQEDGSEILEQRNREETSRKEAISEASSQEKESGVSEKRKSFGVSSQEKESGLSEKGKKFRISSQEKESGLSEKGKNFRISSQENESGLSEKKNVFGASVKESESRPSKMEKYSEKEEVFGMKLHILAPGAFTTVQDRGRFGFQYMGVTESGAMDREAADRANRLLENDLTSAVLEMTASGASFYIEGNGQIVFTGADMKPVLNGQPLKMDCPVRVKDGDRVECGFAADGCRGYLGVSGGIDVPMVMGSRSTLAKCAIGGFFGRALRAGDIVKCFGKADQGSEKPHPFLSGSREIQGEPAGEAKKQERVPYSREITLHYLPGPQADCFPKEVYRLLEEAVYTVDEKSDRMGYRMNGPKLPSLYGTDIISDGIVFGSIQIPADGRPIVLMADHQTTGGYAKIGTVISRDLPKLAQLLPGGKVHFSEWKGEGYVKN